MVETALGKVAGSFPACTRKVLSRLTSSANCSGDWWPGPAELSHPSARRATRRNPALLPQLPIQIGRPRLCTRLGSAAHAAGAVKLAPEGRAPGGGDAGLGFST